MDIEEGRKYLTRDGREAGPLTFAGRYFYDGGRAAYDPEGHRIIGGRHVESGDIVREWEPPAENPMRAVVGECPTKAAFATDLKFGQKHPVFIGAPGYEPLLGILREAHDQAATGKGQARHARGEAFAEQASPRIARVHGVGYATGQAAKKVDEAAGMLDRGEDDAAVNELLGAINFAAMAVLAIRERSAAKVAA